MNHVRHMNIFNAKPLEVTLIGAGGIGSMTALVLAKMGVGLLEIFDGDLVSEENIATQWHAASYIGCNKAVALVENLAYFADTRMISRPHMYCGLPPLGKIVISAVDSIASRKMVWRAVLNHRYIDWYLEARMGAEAFQLYTVGFGIQNEQRILQYGASLDALDDSQFPEVPCTMKSTFFCASYSASMVGLAIRDIARGEKPPYFQAAHLPARDYVTFA